MSPPRGGGAGQGVPAAERDDRVASGSATLEGHPLSTEGPDAAAESEQPDPLEGGQARLALQVRDGRCHAVCR